MVDYRNYVVWKKSHRLVIDIYKTTGSFPNSEQYNFVPQINGAVL